MIKTFTLRLSNETCERYSYCDVSSLAHQLTQKYGNRFELIDETSGCIACLDALENEKVYWLRILPLLNSNSDFFLTKDPVHDIIRLPFVCRHIIDTAEYQRLRQVKQTGVCQYIFLGAQHSRFEHSIGTAHLAHKLMVNLQIKHPFIVTNKQVELVTVAALLHDVGHGPFSHAFEEILGNMGHRWTHEDMSRKLAFRILSRIVSENGGRYFSDEEILFITQIIHPEDCMTESQDQYLFEIVSNKLSGVDVDKFDYILRDSYYTGVRVAFEVSKFIESVSISEQGGIKQLVYATKEFDNIWELFHTRASLHRRVYQHKSNKALEGMIKDVFTNIAPHMKFKNEHGNWLSFTEAVDDTETFLLLSDWIIHYIEVGDRISTDFSHPQVKEAQGILSDIKVRHLWKCLGQINNASFSLDDKAEIEKASRELSAFTGGFVAPSEFQFASSMVSWGMGEHNPLENINFVTKRKEIKRIRDASKMLPEKFREQKIWVFVKNEKKRSAAEIGFSKWCNAQGFKATANEEDIEFTAKKRNRTI
jgi:deoxynucleoside triphosphate triphosphohydrolase SAMHD1